VDVEDLKEQLRREIATQQQSLDDNRKFLAELERRTESTPALNVARRRPTRTPQITEALAEEGLRQIKAGEKGEIIIEILREGGRQSPKAIKGALRERGIDPDAGTEVKRVLWQLAKDEKIVRHPDAREYEFPQTQLNGHRTTEDSPL
jgi:hypothetical protein